MEIESLRLFNEIASGATFQQAAEKHNLTQSTVSKRIMNLEHELQNKLFIRHHRTVTLTVYGKFLYERSKTIVAEYQKIIAASESFARNERLMGHIAGSELAFDIASISNDFAELHPNLLFSLERCSSLESVKDMLISNETDFVIMHKPYLTDKSLTFWPLTNDPLYVVLPRTHPLVFFDKLSINQIRPEPFLMSDYTASYLAEIFSEHIHRPNISLTLQGVRINTILSLIEKEKGIAILFGSDLQDYQSKRRSIEARELIGIKAKPLVLAVNANKSSSIAENYRDYLIRRITTR